MDQEMEAEAEAATGEALGLRALRPVERKRTDGEMEAEAARPTMCHETTKAEKQGCTRTNRRVCTTVTRGVLLARILGAL